MKPIQSSPTVSTPSLLAPPLPPGVKPSRTDVVWKLGIVAALAVLILAVPFTSSKLSIPLISEIMSFAHERVSVAGAFWKLLGLFCSVYALAVLYQAVRYRPFRALADAQLPSCSVIVPAYNEGKMVRNALLSALESNYPTAKLSVIAVDDGSTDDTWEHIAAVAAAYPDRVVAIRQAKNGGKREALRVGFERARGEMVVTVDSDSKLEPDAVRQAVAPMVIDGTIAAVAGKVLVLNRYATLLTRLLAARFYITFDLVRAAQSEFGAVLCCPGALTAYRRSAVLDVLNDWSEQTFLGSPCTIGEDRALTTWLLRAGHRSVYQRTAVVQTLMPTTFRGVVKMLIRWERGNVRESLAMLPTLMTPWRKKDRWWPTFEIVFDLLQYPIAYVSLGLLFGRIVQHPVELLRFAATLGVLALLQSLYCLRFEKGTDFLYNVGYSFLAVVGLQWVFPYSCLTLRDGRWMTR